MRVFDFSFDEPSANLALDEVLLENAESADAGECLRFWESTTPFVVLGLTQRLADHVHEDACAADGVSILRRCTAGGCVLQAPGSLNYAFVLRTDRDGCGTIHGAYRVILGGIAASLRQIGVNAELAGVSDLALGANKVSGNAQKRKRRFFLHHGTLLYGLNVPLCARYLKEPPDRPDYRGDRHHAAFVRNLTISRDRLVRAVSEVFHDSQTGELAAHERLQALDLAVRKYRSPEWVYRR